MAVERVIVWILLLSCLLHTFHYIVDSSNDTQYNGKTCKSISLQVKQLMKNRYKHPAVEQIYCVKGDPTISPFKIWSTIEVKLNFETEGCRLYQADSCEALEDTQNPSLAKRFLSLVAETDAITSNVFYLSPFKDSCFSVHIPVDHHIKHNDHVCLTFNRIRWQFPLSLIFGLILFLHAESLSRSATFYYSSGIVLGVGFSLLLAVFLLHRFVPSRAGAYALLAGGWSVSLYFLQWSWNNLVNLVLERNIFVIGYFTLAGVISFCLCYYNGPVTNDRGINLIRWTIQLIATYFIYKGVQPESLSVAVVVVVYTYNFASSDLVQRILSILPQNFISYKVQYYLFPPKTRLLTANEYEAEGMIQTRKALIELREYCSSPECDTWKVISRIHNPKRFSSFMTEGTHITDQEYEQFEEDPFEYSSPDDSEECVND